MQKRSKYTVINAEVDLDATAIVTGFDHRQGDKKIDFLHQHALPELGYCHRGEGVFILDHQLVAYGPGDVVLIPAGVAHLAQSASGTSSDWTFCYIQSAALFAELGQLAAPLQGLLTQLFHFKRSEFEQLSKTCALLSVAVTQSAAPTAARVGYVVALLGLIAGVGPVSRSQHQLGRHQQTLAPAINYLARHYAQPLVLDDLAADCGLSSVHFRRLFTQQVGMSPRSYLFKLRIEMAKILLHEPRRSIVEIALQVGFVTLSSFNRQFRKQTGLSPSGWRKQSLITNP